MVRLALPLLACLAMLGSAPPAPAQQSARALATANDGRGWEAVGRISIAGSGYCTGTLIAPSLVLTAAHCLYRPASGEVIPAASLEFAAGLRNARASAFRNVRRAAIHPEYRYEGRDRVGRVAHDLALLELDRPIRAAEIHPISLGPAPQVGDKVGIVFYATGSDEVPTMEDGCNVMARETRVAMVSCKVNFGASGAPVYSLSEGLPHIVSVVSAKAESEGAAVALAAELGGEVEILRQTLAASDGVMTRAAPVVRAPASAGGAKFVRP